METLAVLDEQQLWAMGLLGDEQIETKNMSREGSAHSEIGYEPAAWVDSETCQLVPELRERSSWADASKSGRGRQSRRTWTTTWCSDGSCHGRGSLMTRHELPLGARP